MSDIFSTHQMTVRSELINRRGHIHRVPRDHSIGEQIETAGLIGLFLFLLAANRPLVGKEEKFPQGVQCLTFIELRVNTPTIRLILQIAEDEERLNQPSILL